MSTSKKSDYQKLEDYDLWRIASALAKTAYGTLDTFPEEERWGMSQTLRVSAFNLTSALAEAYGSADPRDKIHYLGHARRHATTFKNVYIMAHKTAVTKADPETIVEVEGLIKAIDVELPKLTDKIPLWLKQFGPEDSKETQ